jgi:hypothetical protein
MSHPVIDGDAPLRFLRLAYQPDEWIAVFVKSSEHARTAQRVAPVSVVMSSPFQAWLARENHAARNVFVSVNVIRPGKVSRQRRAIGAIRHVFLDADHDGPAVVAAIAARADLPPLSYVLHSSPKRVHVFWRVAGFTIDQVEALQQQLASELDTDPAATSGSQMTRLPGFLNQKRRPACRVTMEYRGVDAVYTPGDFPTPSARPPRGIWPTIACESGHGEAPVRERASRYLATVPPAIAGQHGDLHTFRVCCRLVRGFALADHEALAVLADWNARCEPPWSERDLIAKLRHALRYGREPIGGLLETPR